MSLPLRMIQRAMVLHGDTCVAENQNSHDAITSENAGRLDAALVTPVCHIRFLSIGERTPIPQSLSGIKRGGTAIPFLLDTLFSFASSAFRMFACGLFEPFEPFPSVAFISFTLPLQTPLRVRRATLLHATYGEPNDELRMLQQMPRLLHRRLQSQKQQKYRSFLRTSQACRPSSDRCSAGQQAE